MKTERESAEPILPGSKLHALLMEGIEAADRGDTVDGEEFMAEWIGELSEPVSHFEVRWMESN